MTGALCASPATGVDAEILTGANLLTLCRSDAPLDQGLCHGYFRGHAEVHGFYAALGQGPLLYCIPDEATLAEMEKAAFRWMDRHLQHSDEPASVLIMQALRENYPCEPGGEPLAAPPPSDGTTDAP